MLGEVIVYWTQATDIDRVRRVKIDVGGGGG